MLFFPSRPQTLSFDTQEPLNETAEVPSLRTISALNEEQELDRIETKSKGSTGMKMIDGDSDKVSSLKMNLTKVNSTFNYTTAQEVRMSHSK